MKNTSKYLKDDIKFFLHQLKMINRDDLIGRQLKKEVRIKIRRLRRLLKKEIGIRKYIIFKFTSK